MPIDEDAFANMLLMNILWIVGKLGIHSFIKLYLLNSSYIPGPLWALGTQRRVD